MDSILEIEICCAMPEENTPAHVSPTIAALLRTPGLNFSLPFPRPVFDFEQTAPEADANSHLLPLIILEFRF